MSPWLRNLYQIASGSPGAVQTSISPADSKGMAPRQTRAAPLARYSEDVHFQRMRLAFLMIGSKDKVRIGSGECCLDPFRFMPLITTTGGRKKQHLLRQACGG